MPHVAKWTISFSTGTTNKWRPGFSDFIFPVSLHMVVVLQSVATSANTPVVVVFDFQHHLNYFRCTWILQAGITVTEKSCIIYRCRPVMEFHHMNWNHHIDFHNVISNFCCINWLFVCTSGFAVLFIMADCTQENDSSWCSGRTTSLCNVFACAGGSAKRGGVLLYSNFFPLLFKTEFYAVWTSLFFLFTPLHSNFCQPALL